MHLESESVGGALRFADERAPQTRTDPPQVATTVLSPPDQDAALAALGQVGPHTTGESECTFHGLNRKPD